MSGLHERLRRLLFLVPYALRHQGVTVEEMAARLGLDVQVLQEEIDFLLMVGQPPFLPDDLLDIYQEEGRIYVDLHQSWKAPPAFNAFEAIALAAAAEFLASQAAGQETAQIVRGAVDKIVAALPEDARTLYRELKPRYLMLPAEDELPQVEMYRRAIEEQRMLSIRYYTASRGEASERKVCPYALHPLRGSWYLVAHCTRRQEIRLFRVSRIQAVELTQERFERPADFDAAAFCQERTTLPTRGERSVRIRVSAAAADWARERWTEPYLEEGENGGLVICLHDVSDEFVCSYVASLGGEAIIEEPQELARLLAGQASRALEQYGVDAPERG